VTYTRVDKDRSLTRLLERQSKKKNKKTFIREKEEEEYIKRGSKKKTSTKAKIKGESYGLWGRSDSDLRLSERRNPTREGDSQWKADPTGGKEEKENLVQSSRCVAFLDCREGGGG